MRARVVGPILIGLGVTALVVAGPARSLVPLTQAELRLDAEFEAVAVGEQVSYLDPAPLAEVTSPDVSTTVRVRGDEDTGDADDDTAVWEVTVTTDDADGTLVSTTSTRACLDRRTAEAVDCVAESIDGERVDVRGLTVRFPSDTGRRDYDLWDTTVRQPFPAEFAGEERLGGLSVYRFEQEVPATVIGSVPVPGGLFGRSEEQVPAEVVHEAARILLVEPRSGVVVSTEETVSTRLRGPDGADGATLLAGTFTWTQDAVDDAVARAEDVREERGELRTAIGWTAGGAGVALLAAGALLTLRARAARSDDAEDEPVRVAVPTA